MVQAGSGAWKAEDNGPDNPKFGYEVKDWPHAAWLNTKSVWVKRRAWVFEGVSKNPYYNYGKMIFYVDKELNLGWWKEIYYRLGQYWKTDIMSAIFMESDDKKMKANLVGFWRIVDENKNHATLVVQHVENEFQWTIMDPTVIPPHFTLAGFQRLCK